VLHKNTAKIVQGVVKSQEKYRDDVLTAIHETEIISVSAISEIEMVKIISGLNLKKSDSRN
jgi:hypothetical protein